MLAVYRPVLCDDLAYVTLYMTTMTTPSQSVATATEKDNEDPA